MRGLSRDDGDAMRSCATWLPPASTCCAVLRGEEPSPGVFWFVCRASCPLTAPPLPVARSFARRRGTVSLRRLRGCRRMRWTGTICRTRAPGVGLVVDGHTRREAAKQAGLARVEAQPPVARRLSPG
jgi:hypothetical protein